MSKAGSSKGRTHARFKDNQDGDITVGPFVPNSVDRVFTGTVTFRDLGPWTVSESAPVNPKVVHPGEPRSLRLTLRADF